MRKPKSQKAVLSERIAHSKKTRAETRRQFRKQHSACRDLAGACASGLRELMENAERGYFGLYGSEEDKVRSVVTLLEQERL